MQAEMEVLRGTNVPQSVTTAKMAICAPVAVTLASSPSKNETQVLER